MCREIVVDQISSETGFQILLLLLTGCCQWNIRNQPFNVQAQGRKPLCGDASLCSGWLVPIEQNRRRGHVALLEIFPLFDVCDCSPKLLTLVLLWQGLRKVDLTFE